MDFLKQVLLSRLRDRLCSFIRRKVKAVMKRVNEVSRLTGVSKRTLQYYDEMGLLTVQRSKNNHRLYDENAMERLWQILLYKEMKFELKEIKFLLELSDKEREKYLEKHIIGITSKIHQLDDQIAFVSVIKQHGIMPKPSIDEIESVTYIEKIIELKERWKKRANETI